MKSSEVGGQAVLEGVMMRNKDKYAIAVRKPDKEIVVEVKEYHGMDEGRPILRLPIIRGVVKFIESLTIGINTLTYSASFFEEEEERDKDGEAAIGDMEDENGDIVYVTKNKNKKGRSEKKRNGRLDNVIGVLAVVIAIILAIGIFMIIPYFLSLFLGKVIPSQNLLTILEGIIRILLFVSYIMAISFMKDIKRVFMYHGAEHKVINCIENGFELTVDNVRKQSKQHKRCGTSFSLYVVFLSALFFMFINVSSPFLRLGYRLLLIPVIAGISYEFIRLAGRTNNKLVGLLSKPGFWLQNITTIEPDRSMIEVAIRSIEAVFDWRTFISESREERKMALLPSGVASKERNRRKTKYTKIPQDNVAGELDNLDKVFDMNKKVYHVSNTMKRNNQRSAMNDMGMINAKEEDDKVLMALDKFFIIENEEEET